jgi:hypothetical protein
MLFFRSEEFEWLQTLEQKSIVSGVGSVEASSRFTPCRDTLDPAIESFAHQ